MRRLSLCIFPIFIFCLATYAQQPEKEIHQGIERFFDALSLRDTAMVRKTVTSDFLLVEDGEIWNSDTLTTRMSQFKAKSFSRVNSFKFLRTERKEDMAWVAYHNTAFIKVNENKIRIEWLETAVLVRTGNKWVIKMLHSTEIASKKEN